MPMIQVENLRKEYGSLTAVDDVSFSIHKGEIFGFLGSNGAGKTSTINMLIGLSRPTSGRFFIGDIDGIKDIKRIQAHLGVVADESNLYDEMTGFENLCFCGALYGMEKKTREEAARLLLKQFYLSEASDRRFGTYSKGMKRKLTIAAGIIHQPSVLFLDEPTTGIDVENARDIRELVLQLKKRGTTVFITTHYLEEAERLCDRIAFISQGKIVAQGTIAELLGEESQGHRMQVTVGATLSSIQKDLSSAFPDYRLTFLKDNQLELVAEKEIDVGPLVDFFTNCGIPVLEAKRILPTLEDVFLSLSERGQS